MGAGFWIWNREQAVTTWHDSRPGSGLVHLIPIKYTKFPPTSDNFRYCLLSEDFGRAWSYKARRGQKTHLPGGGIGNRGRGPGWLSDQIFKKKSTSIWITVTSTWVTALYFGGRTVCTALTAEIYRGNTVGMFCWLWAGWMSVECRYGRRLFPV